MFGGIVKDTIQYHPVETTVQEDNNAKYYIEKCN